MDAGAGIAMPRGNTRRKSPLSLLTQFLNGDALRHASIAILRIRNKNGYRMEFEIAPSVPLFDNVS